MSNKLNLLELESLRSELIEKTLNTSSNNLRLFLYQNYFEQILQLNNPNLEEAFLQEFVEDYINCICKFEVGGVKPEFSKKILEQLKKVSTLKITVENVTLINSEIDRIQKQLEKQILILDGKDFDDGKIHKAFFPLIDKGVPKGLYGVIDSVTVRISKAADSDKFIIVPSEKEIEKRIAEQCTQSWHLAQDLSKKYLKKSFKYHEVIISFDKKQGFYEGNSLGIALTLSFLEQILKFYNPVYIINIKEQSAFTGGVTEVGEVLCTSEEIIKRKVATIFFSEINSFVFPKCEETYAYFALTQLKKNYPNRKLKLIPAEDINDVLNRRDIVDIKKQKLIVRSGKFVKKNWISALATVLLAVIFAYLFVMDFDDNPASVLADGNKVHIKNKKGKTLWSKDLIIPQNLIILKDFIKRSIMIVDVNEDSKNEVLFIGNSERSIKCLDYKQNELWQFKFEDQVESVNEKLNTDYGIYILDTLTFEGKKSIYLVSSNEPSFSSAIYRINASDGKRLPGTLWAAGHFMDAMIFDYDNDGQKEIIGVGYDNGYEDLVFFITRLDTLTRMRPTTLKYFLNNIPLADMKQYIRIPKTDYDNYTHLRTPYYFVDSFNFDIENKKFIWSTALKNSQYDAQINYIFNLKDNSVDIVIHSDFRVIRDSLVAQGKLNPPYTDTKEYKELLKSQILYWKPDYLSSKKGKWVTREDLD